MKPKVSIDDAPEILRRWEGGESKAAIAASFDVSDARIRNILSEAGVKSAAGSGNVTGPRHPEIPEHSVGSSRSQEDGQESGADVCAAAVWRAMQDLRAAMKAGKPIYLEPAIRYSPALALAADRMRRELKSYDGAVTGLESLDKVLEWHGLR